MMDWYETAIAQGWKGPKGRPRGAEMAEYPLQEGVWYRVSMSPDKAHVLQPDTTHAFCGLTLAPDEGWLINSGYERFFWIVEDTRKASKLCGDCSKYMARWRPVPKKQLPSDSPISADEWAAHVGPQMEAERRFLEQRVEMLRHWGLVFEEVDA